MGLTTDDINNPLRHEDKPFDPYIRGSKNPALEESYGTKHPSRFEPKQSTVVPSQATRIDTAQVVRTGALSIPSGVQTKVTWSSVVFDTIGLWDNATKFIIPPTGKQSGPWLIHGEIAWDIGNIGGTARQISIYKNNSPLRTTLGPPGAQSQDIWCIVNDPSANDFYEISLFQDSGGAIALNVSALTCFFEIIHPW